MEAVTRGLTGSSEHDTLRGPAEAVPPVRAEHVIRERVRRQQPHALELRAEQGRALPRSSSPGLRAPPDRQVQTSPRAASSASGTRRKPAGLSE